MTQLGTDSFCVKNDTKRDGLAKLDEKLGTEKISKNLCPKIKWR